MFAFFFLIFVPLLAQFLNHLDAPTKAPSWPANGCTVRSTPFEIEENKGEEGEEGEEKEQGEEKVGYLGDIVKGVCEALIGEKEKLNEIDSHVRFYYFCFFLLFFSLFFLLMLR